VLGERREVSSQDADELLDDGWIPDTAEQSNFLEGVHIQACYFQVLTRGTGSRYQAAVLLGWLTGG
jgi:hypothetical protein